jgi:hypothetical protein
MTAKGNDNDLEIQRWLSAIEAADTWRDPSQCGPRKTGNLKPLAALFRSGAPVPPSVYDLLADLLSRHRLKSTTQRTPIGWWSDSQCDAGIIEGLVDDFKRNTRWKGPITKAEMNEAVTELQRREKVAGRGKVEFDGKKAATQLRQEELAAYCDYNGLDHKRFKTAFSGRYGPINRTKVKS